MIQYLLLIKHRQFTLMGCVLLFTLAGCRRDSTEDVVSSPPTQRARAVTSLSLGSGQLLPGQISLETVTVGGTAYNVVSIDSSVYGYDNQQRLTSHVLTQTTQANDQRFTLPSVRYDYTYQPGVLLETYTSGPGQVLRRYPLESTNNRVTAYTRDFYSVVLVDTLRKYSSEGILLETLQAALTSRVVNSTTPTLRTTVQDGNVIKQEEYNTTGVLQRVDQNVYDTRQYAPRQSVSFLGETSRNALLSKVSTYTDAGVSRATTYTYQNEYDSQGRLRQQLEKAVSNDSPTYSAYRLIKFYY